MESNIQTKVNRIGKAGKAVSIVLIVLLSIGAFGLLVSGIVCSVLAGLVLSQFGVPHLPGNIKF